MVISLRRRLGRCVLRCYLRPIAAAVQLGRSARTPANPANRRPRGATAVLICEKVFCAGETRFYQVGGDLQLS